MAILDNCNDIILVLLVVLIFMLYKWRVDMMKIHKQIVPDRDFIKPIKSAGLTPLSTPQKKACVQLIMGSDREGD